MSLVYGWTDQHGSLEPDPNADLEELIGNLKVSYVHHEGYSDICGLFTQAKCMDTFVAGISECLGIPQGLSFEEVYACIV